MLVQGEAENNRTIFTYNSTVIGGHIDGNEISLHLSETKSLKEWNGTSILQPELVLVPKLIVNSAGLSAPALAKRFTGLQKRVVPQAYYARGCYFTLSNTKAAPFRHLIYPIPEDGGLGVHVTLDLNGQVKFGPDVEWIDGVDDISSFQNEYFLISFPLHAFEFLLRMIHSNIFSVESVVFCVIC
jgi:L-2-hydroxyglutarate oxidase LhgO